jgi:cullin 4
MGELHKQLKFPLTASDVTQRISSLIDREYLERDVDDPNTYIYLA